jgi:hypothetical protein
MEFGDGKRQDNSEDWAGNVSKEDGEEDWDIPVFAASNDNVEVSTELVSLGISG